MNKLKEKYFKRVEKQSGKIETSVNELLSKERLKRQSDELRFKTSELEFTNEELHTLRNALVIYADFVGKDIRDSKKHISYDELSRAIKLYHDVARREEVIRTFNMDGTKRFE